MSLFPKENNIRCASGKTIPAANEGYGSTKTESRPRCKRIVRNRWPNVKVPFRAMLPCAGASFKCGQLCQMTRTCPRNALPIAYAEFSNSIYAEVHHARKLSTNS